MFLQASRGIGFIWMESLLGHYWWCSRLQIFFIAVVTRAGSVSRIHAIGIQQGLHVVAVVIVSNIVLGFNQLVTLNSSSRQRLSGSRVDPTMSL